MDKIKRVGHHTGYCVVIRDPNAQRRRAFKASKPPSRRKQITAWAEYVLRRHGDMFGDWAVSGMTEEERDEYIGGGSRRLERRANESMRDGLADVIHMCRVPDGLRMAVLRAVWRLSGMQ